MVFTKDGIFMGYVSFREGTGQPMIQDKLRGQLSRLDRKYFNMFVGCLHGVANSAHVPHAQHHENFKPLKNLHLNPPPAERGCSACSAQCTRNEFQVILAIWSPQIICTLAT